MKNTYITIAGIKHYYDIAPFEVGKKVKCVKEPENPYDSEAIKVVMKHIGTVGHVANSVNTVVTGTTSAGRLYDKVGKEFNAEVMFIMPFCIICKVETKKGKK